MKEIILYCQKHNKDFKKLHQSDFLKLRLRGKGSGFKEGLERQGSWRNILLIF